VHCSLQRCCASGSSQGWPWTWSFTSSYRFPLLEHRLSHPPRVASCPTVRLSRVYELQRHRRRLEQRQLDDLLRSLHVWFRFTPLRARLGRFSCLSAILFYHHRGVEQASSQSSLGPYRLCLPLFSSREAGRRLFPTCQPPSAANEITRVRSVQTSRRRRDHAPQAQATRPAFGRRRATISTPSERLQSGPARQRRCQQ